MDLRIRINCDDNDMQFGTEAKAAKHLQDIGQKVVEGFTYGAVMDVNGNVIGQWEFTEPETQDVYGWDPNSDEWGSSI